jgi:hypothetical protein
MAVLAIKPSIFKVLSIPSYISWNWKGMYFSKEVNWQHKVHLSESDSIKRTVENNALNHTYFCYPLKKLYHEMDWNFIDMQGYV